MSFENPLSILYNAEGNELAVSASQVLTGSGIQPGILVAGSSSTGVVQFMKVGTDGAVFVTGSVGITSVGAVDQGQAGTIGQSWYFSITDGTQVIGTGSSAPLWVTGAVDIGNPVAVTDGGGSLTVDGTVAVTDGGGSITVDGTVNVGNFPTTQSVDIGSVANGVVFTVTGTVTSQINQVVSVSNGGPIGASYDPLYVTGSFTANFDPSTSATVTPVSSSATVVTLQAANGARRGLTVYNSSNKSLYLKLGSAAALDSFTVRMTPQGYFEVPGNYTGIVTGIWDSANGFAYVTEILD